MAKTMKVRMIHFELKKEIPSKNAAEDLICIIKWIIKCIVKLYNLCFRKHSEDL